MGKSIKDLLENWPKSFIHTSDLMMLLGRRANACYLVIKRTVQSGLLIHVRRGLYLIASKIKQRSMDEFELAMFVYGPSFVSLESALSYHGWIPEAVYVTTSVSTKRAWEFKSPVGMFVYKRVPSDQFYTGVDRIETDSGVFFIASPWRAIADLMYTGRKHWGSISELEGDLRIDREVIVSSEQKPLELLVTNYPSRRVRENLEKLLKEIAKIS